MFVLVANLWGMFPYFFTVTSHIVITAALALSVILTVVVYGFWRHKLALPQAVRAERRAAGRSCRSSW